MNCEAVKWARAQNVRSASAGRLLIEIAALSEDGQCSRTQAELGRLCKLSERQTRTLIAQLAEDGVIRRTRVGGTGKGRAPDVYELVGFEATRQPAIVAASVPAKIAGSPEATGNNKQVAATGNRQELPVAPKATGEDCRTTLPVAATGNAPPRTPYKNITLPLELNPETPELDGEGGAGGAPKRRAKPKFTATDATMPSEPSAKMREFASGKGFVNGSVDRMFEQWRNHHIAKGTVLADADASFRTWVGNQIDWGKGPAQSSNAPPVGRVERGIYPMVYKG